MADPENPLTPLRRPRAGRWLLLLALATLGLEGLAPCGRAADPGEGGIGGTGMTNEGIGGTGISRLVGVGAIQRFGSIFVNGREYFINAATRIQVNGAPAAAAALHLGDVVVVRARATPAGRATASAVRVEVALAGRIEGVDARAGRFTLLGQAVAVTTETRTDGPGDARLALAQLRVGEAVRVSGFARGDGSWVATRVAPGPVMGFWLRGRVGAIDAAAGRVTIGGERLTAAPEVLAGLAPGARVRVSGRYVRGAPVVTAVARRAPALGAPGTAVEMAGYVEARAGSAGLRVDGVRLRTTAHTRFHGGGAGALRPGVAIAVRGVTESDGGVRVTQAVLGADPMQVDLPAVRAPRAGAGEGHAAPRGERPEGGRPEVERPQVERPEIERPEIEIPEQSGG